MKRRPRPIECVTPAWALARSRIERAQLVPSVKAAVRARILNVTPEEYLADPCRVPSLNSGIAHLLVSESPLHAWHAHPRFGHGSNGIGTEAMQDGALIHRLLLGKGKDFCVVDFNDYRTDAAKEIRDTAIAGGKIPVKRREWERLCEVAGRLRDKCAAYGFDFSKGDCELAVEWIDDTDTISVLCRSMFDFVQLERGVIVDVKKVASANPRQISRTFFDYGFDIQNTAYTRALEALRPELQGKVRLTFLFLEIERPYSVVPVEPGGEFREIGALRWERALQTWRQCVDSGRWPGYCETTVRLEAPRWLVTQELGTWEH